MPIPLCAGEQSLIASTPIRQRIVGRAIGQPDCP